MYVDPAAQCCFRSWYKTLASSHDSIWVLLLITNEVETVSEIISNTSSIVLIMKRKRLKSYCKMVQHLLMQSETANRRLEVSPSEIFLALILVRAQLDAKGCSTFRPEQLNISRCFGVLFSKIGKWTKLPGNVITFDNANFWQMV